MNFPSKQKILKKILSGIFLTAVFGLVMAQQNAGESVSVGADEASKAVRHFGGGRDLSKVISHHLDGVMGEEVINDPEPPIYRKYFPDRRLDAIHQEACSAAVFGEAELLGKKSFVGSQGQGVFTKLRFKLINDWRPGNDNNAKVVHVIVEGGEADWNGRRYRIKNKRSDFNVGHRYVLIAGSKSDSSSPIVGEPPFLEIENVTIYAPPGWTLFPNGTTVKQAKAEVEKVLAARACQ